MKPLTLALLTENDACELLCFERYVALRAKGKTSPEAYAMVYGELVYESDQHNPDEERS